LLLTRLYGWRCFEISAEEKELPVPVWGQTSDKELNKNVRKVLSLSLSADTVFQKFYEIRYFGRKVRSKRRITEINTNMNWTGFIHFQTHLFLLKWYSSKLWTVWYKSMFQPSIERSSDSFQNACTSSNIVIAIRGNRNQLLRFHWFTFLPSSCSTVSLNTDVSSHAFVFYPDDERLDFYETSLRMCQNEMRYFSEDVSL
jgi:hypothetical protein